MRVDFKLVIGARSETIEVNDAARLVNTENFRLSYTVDSGQIANNGAAALDPNSAELFNVDTGPPFKLEFETPFIRNPLNQRHGSAFEFLRNVNVFPGRDTSSSASFGTPRPGWNFKSFRAFSYQSIVIHILGKARKPSH